MHQLKAPLPSTTFHCHPGCESRFILVVGFTMAYEYIHTFPRGHWSCIEASSMYRCPSQPVQRSGSDLPTDSSPKSLHKMIPGKSEHRSYQQIFTLRLPLLSATQCGHFSVTEQFLGHFKTLFGNQCFGILPQILA